jgi:CxxC motif-containing protein (DUF1111 family)
MHALKPIVPGLLVLLALPLVGSTGTPTEAPTGFDNLTNGFVPQAQMDADRTTFEEREGISDGLGPVYNAQSCAECHQTPVTGAISQITELRVGHTDSSGNFVNPTGGRSLINDRATDPAIQMRVPLTETIQTFRTSLNTLGDGFVEAVNSNDLVELSERQPRGMQGEWIQVPVLESPGQVRVGRFGWKDQHASLLSFSSDAYLNEMGVTNQFNLIENNSLGNSTSGFPGYHDPNPPFGEDQSHDINAFTEFMRTAKAPPRDTVLAASPNAQAGQALFQRVGCTVCHVPNLVTAAAGTVINGGALTVPPVLGNVVFHPYSDFLLHNVGTGDGIQQNGPADTARKVRTAPLWGSRTRDRLMHDGLSLTTTNAILRHSGEATPVINNFMNLSSTQKAQLITFLNSL